jgi:hypothetical protein
MAQVHTGSAEYTDSPPFFGQFNPTGGGTYSEDDTSGSTVYPQSLQPGASAVMITGTFSLRTTTGMSRCWPAPPSARWPGNRPGGPAWRATPMDHRPGGKVTGVPDGGVADVSARLLSS